MAKKRKKPNKPYADFPLYAHAGGVWAKKIRGKVHYFGPWSDPQGALDRYLNDRDHLLAGKAPPPAQNTVADLLNKFLGEKKDSVDEGDITESTYADYERTCVRINDHFGKQCNLDTLATDDFKNLRKALANGISPVTLKRRLTIARMVFSDVAEAKKALKSPKAKSLRAIRRQRGVQLYSANDVRKLVKTASPDFRAMILLGINCGFGPQDCCTIPADMVDLKGKWHNYPRPKTEVERRCSLWSETAEALKKVASEDLVFNGRTWDRFVVDREFKKTCSQAKVKDQGFYTLRRTFETIAATGDVPQPVIDAIMGHARNDMASIYRQKVFDVQLKKCTEHVRQWYLGKIAIH